jgi:hypothetical protein
LAEFGAPNICQSKPYASLPLIPPGSATSAGVARPAPTEAASGWSQQWAAALRHVMERRNFASQRGAIVQARISGPAAHSTKPRPLLRLA